jgi:hypothetical protein
MQSHLAFIWLQFHNFQLGVGWVNPENETDEWLKVQSLSRGVVTRW